ncbi:golgin subfamily A member 6-like protein 1 isoform X2 [Cherax quadricarinatus]|uniref:golgin subfamily A member 6-like protein 1 isoform X2 n=1 Tax=Cherax quadricarinatus TaxID=27406 RepID=UPI00387E59FE
MNLKIIKICCILLTCVLPVAETGKRRHQGRSQGHRRSDVLVEGKDQSPRARADLQHTDYYGLLEAEILRRQADGPDVEVTREDLPEGGHPRYDGAEGGHPRQHDAEDSAHPRQHGAKKVNHGALKDQLYNLQVLLEESRRQERQSKEEYHEIESISQECSQAVPEAALLLQQERRKTEELRALADAKALELKALQETHESLKRKHGKANARVKKWDRKTSNLVKARNEVENNYNNLQEEHERQLKAYQELLQSHKKERKQKKELKEKYKKHLSRNRNIVEHSDKHRSLNNELEEKIKDLEKKLNEKHSQFEALRGDHNELENEHRNVKRIAEERKKENFKLAEPRNQAVYRYDVLLKEHKKERKVYDKASRKHETLSHSNNLMEHNLENLQKMLDEKDREEKEYLAVLKSKKEKYNELDKTRADHHMRERKWLRAVTKFKEEANGLYNQLKRYRSLTEERERELHNHYNTLADKDEKIGSLTKELEAVRLSVADSQQDHSQCQREYQNLNLKYRRALHINDYLKSSPH